jgi:hypothetical protein
MPSTVHDWAETLELGRQGEEILDAVFGPDFIIVKATAAHQRQGVDRFLINRKDGTVIHRVDYKCDFTAGRTGNLALEHVSVVRKGQHRAAGSVHTTIAELIISYVPALELAFILEVSALRLAWPDIMRLFPPRMAATAGPSPYQSLVCCVPIAWLRNQGLIVRTVKATPAQLRLPLTARRAATQ